MLEIIKWSYLNILKKKDVIQENTQFSNFNERVFNKNNFKIHSMHTVTTYDMIYPV